MVEAGNKGDAMVTVGCPTPRGIGAWLLGLLHVCVLAVLAVSAPPAQGTEGAAASPCTLVFGHGRNPSSDDESANRQWDEANRHFASQVALEIAERDVRTVLVLASVATTDVALIVRTLLDNARRERCDRIVETTLFEQDDELLVARLREYPVLGTGPQMRIGEPRLSYRQEYPNTQRNRDRLVPAALGKSFAQEYLQQRSGATPAKP